MGTSQIARRFGCRFAFAGAALAVAVAVVLAANAAARPHRDAGGSVAVGRHVEIATLPAIGERREVSEVVADPARGGWVVLSKPDGLFRVGEGGAVRELRVPRRLQGAQFELTPLSSGWGLATARVFPGGRSEEEECSSAENHGLRVGRCGVMVAAQLGPHGRWTAVRRLPHSSGPESSGFEVSAEAIESGGRIELVWCRECEGGGLPGWIATARPGGRLGKPHRVQRLPGNAAEENLETFRGRPYIRAWFDPRREKDAQAGQRVIEREIHPDGSLGPAHVMRSRLTRFEGVCSWLGAGGGSSEELVFSEGGGGRVGVARRDGWQSTRGRPRYISDTGGCSVNVAQAADHRLLIVTEAKSHGRRRIVAAQITPGGRLGPARTVERYPPGRNSEDEAGTEAVNNAGQALVATSPVPLWEEEPSAIWLHGSTRRCPAFSRSLFLSLAAPEEYFRDNGEELRTPEMFAGAHGVFHLVWRYNKQIETATVRLRCGHS